MATTSSNSQVEKLSSKIIDALFIRFTTIYGHAWISLHKEGGLIDSFKKEWADALSDFDKKIIKEALMYCRTRYRLPPNLPEFIECCKLFENRWRPKHFAFEPLQPKDLAAGKQELQKMKHILNMK
jgi:hypothetical protein